jgi:hypothetical protein
MPSPSIAASCFPLQAVLFDLHDSLRMVPVSPQGWEVARLWSAAHHVLQDRAAAGFDLADHRRGQVRRRVVPAAQHEAALITGGELDPDAKRPERRRFRPAVPRCKRGVYLMSRRDGPSGDRHEAADLGDDVSKVGALPQGGDPAQLLVGGR